MIKKTSILVLLFSLYSSISYSFPKTERLPVSAGAPLDIFSSQVTRLLVSQTGDFADRYIIGAAGKQITIIDTETWNEIDEQPLVFDDTIGGMALMPDGNTLVVTLGDGTLAEVELDNIENENVDVADASDRIAADPRVIDLSGRVQGSNLGPIIADADLADDAVYFLDTSNDFIYFYDITNDTLISVELLSDDLLTTITPHDLVFTDGSGGQKIFMAAENGQVLVMDAGDDSLRTLTLSITDDEDEDNPDFSSISATPDGEYVYVVDNTNDVVWVIDTSSETFVDQLSGGEVIDPIRFDTDENTSLSDIFLTDVLDPDGVYGYVAGADGVSVVNATSPTSITTSRKIVDIDTATSDVLDPVVMSGTPGPLAASSDTDGYVYSSNGDATISVISDNPFVTIDESSVITLTEADSTFSLSFQSDETGTYDVIINSDITGASGDALLEAQTLDTADVDIATTVIDMSSFDRAVFEEGTNRVFIFVTDNEGHVGRDAFDITVDRPPGEVTITDTNFGNRKIYVSFTALPDNDISVYSLYAKEAESQVTPVCPGTLDFTTSPDGTGTVSGSCSGTCEGSISGLTNGIYYCVAMDATDNSSQTGVLSTFDEATSPELTVGAAGLLGETGCALNKDGDGRGGGLPLLLILLITLVIPTKAGTHLKRNLGPCFRRDDKKVLVSLFLILTFFSFISPSHAQEISKDVEIAKNPEKKNFTFELKGSLTFPTNDVVKDIYGSCCNFSGEVEFGYLYKSKLNFTIAAGAGYLSGTAVGVNSGLASGDSAGLLIVPIRNNIIFRFDFLKDQIVVPYVGVGGDYVIFRESVAGDSIKGLKVGFHGMGGVAILLNKFEDIGGDLRDSGIDDMFLTIEGRYNKIDSFKSSGLDLSGFSVYVGFLMAF